MDGIAARPAISREHACALLKIGRRQLRGLIRAGTLVVTGSGHGKQILAASLEAELRRRKEKWNPLYQNAAICTKSLPNLLASHLDGEKDLNHHGDTMILKVPNERPEALSPMLSLAAAASQLGMDPRVFRRIVASGELPVITVGSRQRVSENTLRTWVAGRKVAV